MNLKWTIDSPKSSILSAKRYSAPLFYILFSKIYYFQKTNNHKKTAPKNGTVSILFKNFRLS